MPAEAPTAGGAGSLASRWPPMGALVQSLDAASRLVVDLLAEAEMAAPIPNSEWTVRQAAAHLVAGTHMYAACLEGVESPLRDFTAPTLTAFNGGAAMALAALPGSDFADQLAHAVHHLTRAANATRDPGVPVRWHAAIVMPSGFLVRTIVMELLLHGGDVAAALGAAWEPPEDVAVTAVGLFADTAPLQFRKRRARGFEGSYRCDTALGPVWAFAVVPSGARPGEEAAVTIEPRDHCCDADGVVQGPAMTLLRWTSGRAGWDQTSLVADGRLSHLVPRLMDCFSPL